MFKAQGVNDFNSSQEVHQNNHHESKNQSKNNSKTNNSHNQQQNQQFQENKNPSGFKQSETNLIEEEKTQPNKLLYADLDQWTIGSLRRYQEEFGIVVPDNSKETLLQCVKQHFQLMVYQDTLGINKQKEICKEQRID